MSSMARRGVSRVRLDAGAGVVAVGIVLAAAAASSVPAPAAAQDSSAGSEMVESQEAVFTVEVVADGFQVPYAIDFLPDGRMLVSDRNDASLWLVDPASGHRTEVTGLPAVYRVEDGGGMHDVLVHPDYASNGWIYFDYAFDAPDGVTLAVSRARLDGSRLVDHRQILLIRPGVPGNADHLGSRMVLDHGHLFVTMGEHYDLRDRAQELGDHFGTVLRVTEEGGVPADNPFVGVEGALPEIWSYGHRNPQGLALHPVTGALWSHEHGPQGGDEINIIRPGRNYGWPIISYGREYEGEGGGPVGDGIKRRHGLEQPIYFWTPSIAPSDMLFYQGDAFPDWRGDLFTGGMAIRHLNRIELDGDRVLHEERLLGDRDWRVRSLAEGPDGLLYLGVDAGLIVRLRPR